MDWSGCGWSGWCWDGWLPGVAGDGRTDAGQDVDAVFAHGVDVGADVEAVLGGLRAGEPAGDLLLGLGRAQAAFADVVGGPAGSVEALGEELVNLVSRDLARRVVSSNE